MISPRDYIQNYSPPADRSRLVLGRKANGPGVVIPASHTTVRIVRDDAGHLNLEVQAPRDVKILREEIAGQ